MAFLTLFFCFSFSLLAQTQPTPQTLPYTQDFSALASTYPAGMQGGVIGTAPSSSYPTTDSTADKSFITGTSNSGTSAIYNYTEKIGFLNGGSFNLDICLAINTQGKYGIEVKYDAMTIRNPGTRSNEMVLQYRIGTTTAFTTLPETAYLNNLVVQTTPAVITPQNSKNIKIILPSGCNDQAVVQIRWISKDVSSSGSRPSFAIDNISVLNDIIAPLNVSGFPKIDNVLSNGFDFSTQINEIGKTYYVLLAGGSAKPSVAQIKAGLDANGNSALQADVIAITDASLVYTKSIIGLNLNTSYTLYSIAEDTYGNSQADSNQLDVTTANVLVPSINTTISSLDLGFSEQNFDSNTLSYQVQASNLTDAVTLTATGNFTISKEANANFQTSLTFASTDFDANNTPTVYVRFTPNTTGDFSGQITHQTSGASDKTVTVTGIGINPYIQNFNDTNVLSNSGWTAYSVTGSNIKWVSTTSRFNSSPAAVQINGYTEAGASNDWLISPKLRLDNFANFPIVSFYSRNFFAGSTLKLMVSVDYDGVSSPETATWTALEGDFPTTTGVFKQSNYINLEGYKTNHTYLAWVYQTTTNTGNNAAEWTIDDISIANETTFLASNPNLSFEDTDVNTASVSQSFIFKAGGYGDVTITAPTDFELSADNITFQSNVLVSEAAALLGKTIYARFAPSTKALSLSGTLTVTATGLNQQIGSFSGSSWPKAETFDIVSYNLEFFGSDVKNKSNVEFGPTDDVLQIENVAKVMNKLNADVYVVQEVSDDPSIDRLIEKLNINGKTFDKTISPSWSYSFNTPDPNFPPQKLVVLYNTQTTTVKKSRVMFKDLYDNIQSGSTTLANYPGGNSASFFASGRLPFMVEIETNIAGVKKDIKIIDIHARANSGTDISKYNMRKYDAEFLKDSLDAQYPNADFMILGDYNDDVDVSVIAGNPSSYQKLVEDTARYNALTLDISKAGSYSFLGSGGFLDHIITSNELTDEYVPNSIAVYDPRTDISNYVNTTSDHGPVIARFELKKTEQTITFNPIASKTYGNVPFDLTSNSSSNLAISYSSSDENIVKIIDGKIKIIGVGTATITASQAGNDFYLAAQNVAQSITVNKAELTIKADDKTKKYKEANPELTAAYSGFVYDDTVQSLTTLPIISTLADVNSIAGEYAISVANAVAKNYTINYVDGKMTVEKLEQTITFNPIASKTYGDVPFDLTSNSSSNLAISYSSSDENIAKIVDGKIKIIGAGTATITASQSGNDFYLAAQNVAQSITVNKAELTIKADDKTKKYKDVNPELTASYSGFVYDDTVQSLTTLPTISTLADVNSIAGEYAISVANAVAKNYTINYVDGKMTVEKLEQTITFNPIASKTYGDVPFDLTSNSSSNLAISYSSSDENIAKIVDGKIKIIGAGTATITTSQSGNDFYLAAQNVVQSITVNKAELTIKADNKTKKYKDVNPELTALYSGFVYDDTVQSLTTLPTISTLADVNSIAGEYAISVANAVAKNYTINYVDGKMTVEKLEQTITFNPIASKTYGNVPFDLTSNSSSNLAISYSSSDENIVKVIDGKIKIIGAGTATITASQSGNDFYLAAQNVAQSITVNKAELTIKADDKTKKYKDVNPELTASYSGFVYDDTVQSLTTLPTISTLADVNSIAGEYAISVANAVAKNYTINYVDGKMTVEKLEQTITFSPIASKTYGNIPFDLTSNSSSNLAISYSSSDENIVKVIDGKIKIIGVGIATITASQSGNDFYLAAQNVAQSITVNKAELTIKADNKTKKYKDVNPELTALYSGFVYDDTVQSLTTLPIISTLADVNSIAGEYAISVANASAKNYTLTYVNGKMIVEKLNNSPIVKKEVTTQSITITNQKDINLLDVFSDADLNVLTYTAEVADGTIVEVTISGSTLTLLSKKAGTTLITITANDGLGGKISTSFTVTISSNLSTIDFGLSKNLSARAYPNPAKDDVVTIAVQSNNEKNILLKLYDINGRLIGSPIEIKETSEENTAKIAVGHLQSGFYFYTLSIDNNVVFKDKIIIQ
ncbi:hypothetical protein DB891_07735 [Flavobacterium laiguense]|uniref:Endonuclease n=2 Tax=Flavobacterium laiguense TaxID=2169409 RepID=A0A2U1JXQ3_9FLAO|nr:hypothetical protein DB891_07735 [Flavobacterium laiguense]